MTIRSQEVDQMIASAKDWRGATLATLRNIIHDGDPDIVEAVKWKRPGNPVGAAVFEHHGIVCIGGLLKQRVRLSFVDGASLPDPKGLFNAMLNGKTRAIDFCEGDKVDAPALKALVRAGVKRRLAKLTGPKTRK